MRKLEVIRMMTLSMCNLYTLLILYQIATYDCIIAIIIFHSCHYLVLLPGEVP